MKGQAILDLIERAIVVLAIRNPDEANEAAATGFEVLLSAAAILVTSAPTLIVAGFCIYLAYSFFSPMP